MPYFIGIDYYACTFLRRIKKLKGTTGTGTKVVLNTNLIQYGLSW